jgi:hypothetical protein
MKGNAINGWCRDASSKRTQLGAIPRELRNQSAQ